VGSCYTSSGLRFLDVSRNFFSGTIPDGIDSFGALHAFDISGNQFTGYFLKTMSNRCTGGFPQLQELRMDHNAFSDTESGKQGALSGDLPVSSYQEMQAWSMCCCGHLQHMHACHYVPINR
jgi:hypothetical protein